TCGACRGPKPGTAADATIPSASKARARLEPDAAVLRNPLLWNSAKDGDVEDLATLAVREGAAGLVEAASDRELRTTAIRAMGYAAGWSQLPFLAKTAAAKDEEEARLALDATLELAARPRRAEDPEDADEFREGCEGLGALARDTTRPRARRVPAIR